MIRRPVLTSSWDPRRREISYKVVIEGTGKFLLFTDESLRLLQAQITKALNGTGNAEST